MSEEKPAASRGALFEPTGHAELDQMRKDGLCAWCRWYQSALAGAAAGATVALAPPVLLMLAALFAAVVPMLQGQWAQAVDGLVQRALAFAAYARPAAYAVAVTAGIGVAYALTHRWTVARNRYFRLGPWETGLDALGAALAGYGLFAAAGYAWEPLRAVLPWVFWAAGPVFAWLLARLHEIFVLLLVRPDWSLAVESTVRVLLPRRFGCAPEGVRVELDRATHSVTVYAPVGTGEAKRARELIQAIPDTRTVVVKAPEPEQPAEAATAVAAARDSEPKAPRVEQESAADRPQARASLNGQTPGRPRP